MADDTFLVENIWTATEGIRSDEDAGVTVEALSAEIGVSTSVVIAAIQGHPILSSVLLTRPNGQVAVRDLPGLDIAACKSIDAIARKLFEVTRQRLLDIEASKLSRLQVARQENSEDDINEKGDCLPKN